VIYDLLEFNIPGNIAGRIEPKLSSILSIPGRDPEIQAILSISLQVLKSKISELKGFKFACKGVQ
jgi:hypothetical protein